MQLCFFDDEIASNFHPLTLTRPVDDLRIGILTIREKWDRWLKPYQTARICTPHLKEVFPSPDIKRNADCIWINSRCLPTKNIVDSILQLKNGEALFFNELLVACKSDGNASAEAFVQSRIPDFVSEKKTKYEPVFITYYWDLLSLNGDQIAQDIKLLRLQSVNFNENDLHESVIISTAEKVFISETAQLEPGVIIIADNGPVYIGPGATIEAGSILRGPVAICKDAQVKMNARIFDASTIGPVCKAGGEVSNCIFHSYSNKSHDGFAGNSIFGQWCNLAAGTITSNLKNNYGRFKIAHWETDMLSDESVQFFGTVFGDFSKTAIHTKINIGTICGVSSNIFSTGFTPKKIPSFTWLGDRGPTTYTFEKAIEAMQAMMARRDVEMSEPYLEMMKSIFTMGINK